MLNFARALRLSQVQWDIYYQLLEGSLSPSELALRMSIEEEVCRDGILQLRDRGLVTESPTDTSRVAAVDPDYAIPFAIESALNEITQVRLGIPQLAVKWHAAHPRYSPHRSADPVFIVEGSDVTIWNSRIQHEAAHQILIVEDVTTNGDSMSPIRETKLLEDVDIRVVYNSAGRSSTEFAQTIRRRAERGEQSRVVAYLPTQMTIADQSIALIVLGAAPNHPLALVATARPIIDVMTNAFEAAWRSGARWVRDSFQHGPGVETLAVLALLAAGHTDESAAARLGLSVRSVRRRVREAMDMAGARSRMSLGASAVRTGWL